MINRLACGWMFGNFDGNFCSSAPASAGARQEKTPILCWDFLGGP